MLSVLYYGADGESVGGHRICPGCGPRSVVELVVPDEIRRRLLERKASYFAGRTRVASDRAVLLGCSGCGRVTSA